MEIPGGNFFGRRDASMMTIAAIKISNHTMMIWLE